MSLLRYAIPLGLLAYFIWRSSRQRLFLLGVPFLMYMSEAVFFRNAKPFWIPGRLEPADHLMMWLVIVWVVYFELIIPGRLRTIRQAKVFGPRLASPEEWLLLGLAAYVMLEIALTILRFGTVMSAIGEAKVFIYLLAGYPLMRGMLCHASREETIDFLAAIVVVNSFAAALFVVHQGLHYPVYAATEYQTIQFMGQTLTRSFYFMPPLLLLALAFCFALRRWTVTWMGVLVVTLVALWISYTRSLLIIAAVELLVVVGMRSLKARQVGLAMRRMVSVVAFGILGIILVFVVFPVESEYFVSRIGPAAAAGSVTGDHNLDVRQRKLMSVWAWIGPESHMLGQGFATPAQNPPGSKVPSMSPDLVWVSALYRLGLVGVIMVVLLYSAFSGRAAELFLHARESAEFLPLMLIAVLVGTLLEGFVSWTFLNPDRCPLGFWAFAFLVAETARRRHDSLATNAEAADA